MGRAIGIDLGTTNSVAAIKEATVHVLQSRESEDLTPSVVTFHKKEPVVGRLALDRMLLAPENTILSVKRLMGRGFRDDNVRRVRERYAYKVIEPTDGTDDDVRVLLDGKEYSPIQVSALILGKIKQDAELRLSDTVEYAVITVPAYFSEKQKDATRKAGQLAGLKVQKILDEPTAAAIAFGVDNVGADDSVTILVYDLGGGTFDVSVITIVGGAFAQLNIEGDMWLGGDDFDHDIMEHVYDHVQATYGLDVRSDARFRVKLKESAEKAKKTLSSLKRTDIAIPGVLKDGQGNLIDVELELSQGEFERMIAKDIARSTEIVMTAIKNAGEAMTPDQIDYVLLVGGSSYIPLVRRSLVAIFGEKKIRADVDPMKCVAYGAAILSAKRAETVECPSGHLNPGKNVVCEEPGCGEPLTAGVVVAPVTPMHYGVQAQHDSFEVIIPKGSSYPTLEPVRKRFATPAANLKRIRVPVYAGMDPTASRNDPQATVWLELPERVPVDTPIDIGFSLDGDGILERVQVMLLDGSGTRVETFVDRGDTKRSQLEKRLEQLRKTKDERKDALTPAQEEEWARLYGQATRALTINDTNAAKTCIESLSGLLVSQVPEWARKASGLCGYTDVVLDHAFLLEDPAREQKLKTLQAELRDCVAHGDEAGAAVKYKELDKATDDLPQLLQVCMLLIRAASTADQKHMQAERDQVVAALHDFVSAIRGHNVERATQVVQKIQPVLERIFGGEMPVSSKTGDEDVVKGGKGLVKGDQIR
jgi:molecular chaperone DnaK